MDTLDHLLREELEPTDRIYLKIDVQGYEHHVLLGASSILDRVSLIECELSTVILYEGQMLFPEMLELFRKHGFHPVGFDSVYFDEATGHCWQLDAIFARCG